MNPPTPQNAAQLLESVMTLAIVLLGFAIMLGGRSCVCWLGRAFGDLLFWLFCVAFRGLVLIILVLIVYLLVVNRHDRRPDPGQAVTVCRSSLQAAPKDN